MADNKARILFLEHYLTDHTDEEHPITTEDLIQVLLDHGYIANRNTIRSDIEALKQVKISVAATRVGNAKGYYVEKRPFRISELKTLIDAVSSSQFISEKDSERLIRKLAGLAPEPERRDLVVTAFCTKRVKTDSTVAYSELDKVNKAIILNSSCLSH